MKTAVPHRGRWVLVGRSVFTPYDRLLAEKEKGVPAGTIKSAVVECPQDLAVADYGIDGTWLFLRQPPADPGPDTPL